MPGEAARKGTRAGWAADNGVFGFNVGTMGEELVDETEMTDSRRQVEGGEVMLRSGGGVRSVSLEG